MAPSLLPDWTPRRIGGADLAAGSIPTGTRFRRHAHEGVHLCCVLDGGFVEAHGAAREDAGPGTVRVSPPARHDVEFGRAGARCVVIELDPADAAVLGPLRKSVFLRDPWLDSLVSRLGRLVPEDGLASVVALEGVLAELLAQLSRRGGARASRRPPSWLEAARERLQDSAGRQTLVELARASGVHRAHVARAFRDHYGMTVGAYARRLRVERAVRLLGDPDRPLVDIAGQAGFADQSHMTRALSQATGSTPARLRARLRIERATPVQDREREPA